MDTELLVENWVEFGRQVITRLTQDAVPFRVAFWGQLPEMESRVLYLVTDLSGPGALYDYSLAFYQSLFKLPKSEFSVGDIKILPTADPIAQAALAIRDRFPGATAVRYRGDKLGPLNIDEVYIYPVGASDGGKMRPTEIMNAVMGLMYGEDAGAQARVTLSDGSSFTGVASKFNWTKDDGFKFAFTEVGTNQERLFGLEDIASVI